MIDHIDNFFGYKDVSKYTSCIVLFICQLPKRERLYWYREIKKILMQDGLYTYENLKNAMENKIVDIERR